MKCRVSILAVIFVLALSFSYVLAEVPQMINYQGKLTTPTGALVDTTVSMTFTIYQDSTNGTPLWSETHPSVVVEYGIFSVLLGGVTTPIPDSVFDGSVRYMGIKVGTDSEMSPRKAIVSVGYAYRSEYADTAEYANVAVSDGDWTIDGDDLYRLNGNVGIGSSNPNEKLTVDGDIDMVKGQTRIHGVSEMSFDWSTGSTYDSPYYHGVQSKDEAGNWGDEIRINSMNDIVNTIDANTNDLTSYFKIQHHSAADGEDLFWVRSSDGYAYHSGNVGIGTTIPAKKLHVAGNVQVDDTLFASYISSNSPLQLQTAGTTRIYVDDTSGKVGIGITNPQSFNFKLNVQGGGSAHGVYGSGHSYGVYGTSSTHGVYGEGSIGVYGSGSTHGVVGLSTTGNGVYGSSNSSQGVFGISSTANGVYGESVDGHGVSGGSDNNEGVYGRSVYDDGVYGRSDNGIGVRGYGETYDFYAAGPGTNYGPFTGAHEVKFSDDFSRIIKPGMVVSVTGETKIRKTDKGKISFSSTLPTVQLSDIPDDTKVFGVVISELSLDEDHWYINEVKEGERFGAVNSLGEGRVWVTNVNGDIQAGDYITTSSIAGYGKKQNDDLIHSYTLGKAIEDIDWNKVTETVEFKGKTYKAYPIAVVYTSG